MSKTTTKSKTQISVETGIKVLNTAIRKKVSLTEASQRFHGKGKNYVSDIKARISDNVKKGNITKKAASEFTSLVRKYESVVK